MKLQLFRKPVAFALLSVFAGSALAATYTMHVPAKGLKPTNVSAPVNPGTNPTPVEPPAPAAPSWSVVGTPTTNFGSSNVGAPAPFLTLSIKNSGGPGTLAIPVFNGLNAQDFSATSTCVSVAKDATCSVSVGFTPSAAGTRTATLTAGTISQTYTGSGIAANPNVALLLHGDGANGSTTFVDAAGNATFTSAGAKISTANSKFGGSSIYLDGASSLTVNSPKLAFGTGDFTIEWWHYQISDSNGDIYNGGSTQPRIRGMGSKVTIFGSNNAYSSANMKLNTWQHYAVVRYNGVETLYQDGKAIVQVANTQNYTGTSATLGNTIGWGYYITAYIDEMRVTKSAVYTSDFTVPTAPY